MSNKHISERYEFRNIKQNEAEEAAEIERICFPPNEACSDRLKHDERPCCRNCRFVSGSD